MAIKILQITTAAQLGGAERLLLGIAEFYDKSVFEIHFCSLDAEGNLPQEFASRGYPFTGIGSRKPTRIPFLLQALHRHITEIGPQIVHSHLLQAGLMVEILHRLPEKRSRWLHLHTRHYGNVFSKFRQAPIRALDHQLMRGVDGVVAISRSVEDYLRSAVKVPVDRIHRIENGVNLSELNRPGSSPVLGAFRKPRIGAVGNFRSFKGLDLLIKATPAIRKAVPNAEVFLIGDGAGRKAIEAWVQGVADREHIHFLGFRSPIQDVLRELDVLVVPSRSEGFGLVACEAMAIGVPVVASAVDGLTEIVIDQQTGLLFPRDDVTALVRQVLRILGEDQLRARLTAGGRRIVAEKYDIRRMVSDLQNLYLRLAQAQYSP